MFVTALLRDAKGEAKTDLPLTLVVKRPDGVEYKRASVADQGLGGRAFAVPLLSGAPAGKWTIDAYADPKAPGIGHAEFLLEDYVPERLDFTLEARQAGGHAGRADRHFARRPIPLRRARRPASTSPARCAWRRSRVPRSPAIPVTSAA